MVYIDTSVIIAYYCPETLSDKIEDYLINLSTPVVSNLTELEFGSAISKKFRTKEISLSDAEKIQAFFQMHLNDDYYIKIPIQSIHYKLAKDWINKFNTSLRSLDALHLAACFANCKTLATADGKLADAAMQYGIEVKLFK